MSKLMLPRHTSMGRALWCTHSLWARSLDEWQRAHDDPEYWPGIEFDKLAHCTHLIWNGLHEVPNTVSFQSPYKSCPGIHGPGPATPGKGNPPMYASDAIVHLQKKFSKYPDACLFALRKRKWRGREMYDVKPGKPQTWLLGQQEYIKVLGFKGNDIGYVNAISAIISGMTKQEIRAIGTHQTRENTLEAIEFNIYRHLFQKLMLELEMLQSDIKQKHSDSISQKSNLPSLPYLLDEIKRKASLNEKPYKSARKKIDTAFSKGQTKEVRKVAGLAIDIFHDPGDIWGGDTRILKWKELVKELESLIKYMNVLHAVFSRPQESENEKEKSKRREKAGRDYEQGVNSIARICNVFKVSIPALPRRGEKLFAWDELRASVIDIFDSLPGETQYRDKYERRK